MGLVSIVLVQWLALFVLEMRWAQITLWMYENVELAIFSPEVSYVVFLPWIHVTLLNVCLVI
jgi:hypothetical protein